MAADEPSLLGKTEAFGSALSQVSVGLNVDVNPVATLTAAFRELNKEIRAIERQMQALQKEADKATNSMQKTANAGRSGNRGATTAGTKMAQELDNSSPGTASLSSAAEDPTGGAGTTILGKFKGMATAAKVAAVANFTASAVNTAVTAIDNRIDSARDYALTADRMSVLYQQMTGLSQRQVQDQYRAPLTDYRLGYGGKEALLGLQARTGINAQFQASSVEALRTYSGFSLSAADGANMMEQMASAPVANRMFMMSGGGLVGIGGKQNSMQSVMENIVRTAGLTDKNLVDGAFAPGSITRSRLTAMGVTGDMQDQVLQYARQNIAFKEKGGVGMYDASKKENRELMGIESNFATQAEETDRVRDARDEQFYSRQADNYADLEKQTQSLIKVFGELEDKLSGIIGARTSNRITSKVLGALGGAVAGTVGFVASGFNPFVGAAAAAGGYSVGTSLGAAVGDPYPVISKGLSVREQRGDPQPKEGTPTNNDANIRVPTYGGTKSLNDVKNMTSFKQLHPNMQTRVLNLLRANPKVGFGEGGRSVENQRRMFLDRYYRVNHETKIFWDGSHWEKREGVAAAAPPGRSMHGIGLAADLILGGETQWVIENAGRFGLRSFHDVNDEPWHVQPSELPGGFGKYIEIGAPWGTGAEPISPNEAAGAFQDESYSGSEHAVGGAGGGFSTEADFGYRSISERVASGVSSTSPRGGGYGQGASGNSSNAIGNTNVSTEVQAAGALSGEDVAKMLYDEGFRGKELVKMLAIGYRESRFVPTAYNPNRSTGDDSYGLFQLNVLGEKLWSWYKSQGLTDPKQLFDARTNVSMAKKLFDANKQWFDGNGFYAWGDYAGSGPGSSSGHTNMAQAERWVQNAQLGDPVDASPAPAVRNLPNRGPVPSPMPGHVPGPSVNLKGGHTFNINVPVTVSNGSPADIQSLAKTIARTIQREIELTMLRST